MAAMKTPCCVKNCPALNVAGLKYINLPMDLERRLHWLRVIGRPDLIYAKPLNHVVCSAHFDDSQIGILKKAPPDAVPTKHVPTKRKGVLITSSTTASQTDFSSSDDDDYYSEFVSFGKRKNKDYNDEKVVIYKRAKPNRKMIICCEIDCNDDVEMYDNVIGGEPIDSLTCSENLPRDSIDLGNRKVFVLHENDNAIKRNNAINNGVPISQGTPNLYIQLTPMTTNNVTSYKVSNPFTLPIVGISVLNTHNTATVNKEAVPQYIQPSAPISGMSVLNRNDAATIMNKLPIPKFGQPSVPIKNPEMSVLNKKDTATILNNVSIPTLVQPSAPIILPEISVLNRNDSGTIMNKVLIPTFIQPSAPLATPEISAPSVENAASGTNIVISDVVSLTGSVENASFKKFFEWRGRTTDRLRGPKFDKDFNVFALNLHTINTRAYRLLMNSWQLPKEKELKDIQLKIGPKFDEQLTRLLTQKFRLLTNEEKYCTLGLYTIALKPHFYYDPANDEVIGVHNVNGVTSKMAANHALVAMVRGLKVPWHQLVAFSLFSTMTDVDNIEAFLTNVYVKLKRMGIKIKGIVMSDDPCFWKYCRSKQYLSTAKVYLSIDMDKVFAVFDIPHILNVFKDDFIKNDFVHDKGLISWKYVKQVYDLDKERGGRLLSKLSEEHLEMNSKERSLKPCQVFSGTVSRAMQFYIDQGLIDTEATPTAEFIKKLNEILDVLNISKLSKVVKCADNAKTIDAQMKTRANIQFRALDTLYFLFKRLTVANSVDVTKEVESLKYFVISLKSLTLISLKLKDMGQTGIVLTRLSYLEPMQEFEKSVAKDAKTNKPTALQFTKAFTKYFVKCLVELTPSPKSIGNMDDFFKKADGLKDCYEYYEGNRVCLKSMDYRFTLPSEYAIIYVSSYLTYKCLEKHKCKTFEDFVKGLVDLDKTKIYVHFEKFNKDAAFYNQLKLPAMAFVSYVERLDNLFSETFDDVYHTTPAETIFDALKAVPKWEFPCTCFPKNYLLKLFVRARIYQTALHNTKTWKSKSNTECSLEVKKL